MECLVSLMFLGAFYVVYSALVKFKIIDPEY